MNKKGFTLVELLGVIVIIGLVIGGSIFGIIGLIKNSKDEATIISESSIKKTASIYSAEKNEDDGYWTEMTRKGYEGKYFCVTVEELINKGLLPKDKDLGNVDIYTYVGIRKDNVTFVNGNPILLKNAPSSDGSTSLTEEQIIYGVCTGNIINEAITKHPVLSGGESFTDEIINISFTDIEGENIKIKESTCSYGLTSSNLEYNGTISGNTCSFNNLKDNTPYYVRVCTSTEGGSIACSDTIAKNTVKIKNPSINLSDKVKITYDNSNIKGDSYYYFKSSINATSDINVSSCTLNNDNTFKCNNDSIANINSNTWYRSTKQTVNLTYSTNGKVNVIARTYDKSNNYAESKKDFNVYKAIFKKGSVDKIGNGTTDITKICLSEEKGTCTIKSPTIEKLGYNVVGWNTSASATTSNWNVNTNKNNVNGTYYPIVKTKTITVTFHRNTSSTDTTKATETFTYDNVSGKTFSAKGWSRTGYTLEGWSETSTGTAKYNVLNRITNTWINNNAPSINLYAVWKPKTITVTFYRNTNSTDATKATETFTYDNVSGKKFSAKGWSRTGYTLEGWSETSTGTAKYNVLNRITNTWIDNNAPSINLYAVWNVNTCTITYNANGGKNAPSDQTVNCGKSVTISSTMPSRSDYDFTGWNTSINGSGIRYVKGRTYTINSDLYLYAQWEKSSSPPTLSYSPSDGSSVCSGTSLTLTCRDNSGSGMNITKIEDNGTISTGTSSASDKLNTLRNGNIRTYFYCEDNDGNVTTDYAYYTVTNCSSGGSGGGSTPSKSCPYGYSAYNSGTCECRKYLNDAKENKERCEYFNNNKKSCNKYKNACTWYGTGTGSIHYGCEAKLSSGIYPYAYKNYSCASGSLFGSKCYSCRSKS